METHVFLGVTQFAVLLLSLSVHESAHAWTANRLGDPTARYLGRISLNPLVHADPFGTFLFPLIGIFTGLPVFGWAKPVPVNVSRLRNPTRDHMFVAAAGPGSNLLMAFGLLGCLVLMKSVSPEAGAVVGRVAAFEVPLQGESILVPLTVVAFYGMMINLILAIFNLIPVAPLDGASVLHGLLPSSLVRSYEQMQRYGFAILMGLLVLGIPSLLFLPVIRLVQSFLIPY